jgi:hypothetical protein
MIRGRVHNGVVELESPGILREGTEVVVEPLPKNGKMRKAAKRPTVSRSLARLAGKAKSLPPDASRNVDHFVSGYTNR